MRCTFGSKRKPFVAVKGVSFDIYKGETFGLVGESGSGKTTIGRAIIRINPTSAWRGYLSKEKKSTEKFRTRLDKTRQRRQIQMIFQDPMASLNERAKVDYIVSEGLMNVQKHLTKEEREANGFQGAFQMSAFCPSLQAVSRMSFPAASASASALRAALIMEPEFIIADEPISALDVSIRAQVLNLLSSAAEGAWPHIPVHRARSFGDALYYGSHRRHPQGRDRGACRNRKAV